MPDRLAIEQDCAKAVTRFFVSLDARDHKRQWDQMTVDGCWKRGGQELNTRDLFLAAMAKRPEHLTIRHMITNMLVDVADGGATAVAIFNLLVFVHMADRGDNPAPMAPPSAIAAFRAELREEDGSWRIALLAGETLFQAA